MLERPNTQYRIFRSLAVGDDQGGGIGAMTLPGTRIRGVIVDNPSGSWVQLDGVGLGFQPFIAPYTMAWSVSLLPSVNELSAKYVDGPIGQPSSNAGAPAVIYVFENQVPSSPGSLFVTPAPAITMLRTQIAATIAGGFVQIIVPPPDAAIRVLSMEGIMRIEPAYLIDAPVLLSWISTDTLTTLGGVQLSNSKRSEGLSLAAPIDLPVGAGLTVAYAAGWGNVRVDAYTGYAIV